MSVCDQHNRAILYAIAPPPSGTFRAVSESLKDISHRRYFVRGGQYPAPTSPAKTLLQNFLHWEETTLLATRERSPRANSLARRVANPTIIDIK